MVFLHNYQKQHNHPTKKILNAYDSTFISTSSVIDNAYNNPNSLFQ